MAVSAAICMWLTIDASYMCGFEVSVESQATLFCGAAEASDLANFDLVPLLFNRVVWQWEMGGIACKGTHI